VTVPLWPPLPGHYRMRLVKSGPWVPVRVFQGFGADPDGGEPRGMWTWRAERRGVEVHIDQVWPSCAGEPISESEYQFLLARADYAMKHDNSLPDATPRQAVDYGTLRFNF
jgi:hypothetical protein